MANEHDLVVIGGGPGGYVAAIRAAQLGLNVACVELEPRLGGTCLRVGCIPSKALLESSERFEDARDHFADMGIQVPEVKLDLATMMNRKASIVDSLTGGVDFLFKKNKVTRYLGRGTIVSKNRVSVAAADGSIELAAGKILIATGSKSAPLRGVEVDGDVIGTSTEALSYPAVPKHLVVIGAGVIGLELGSVWRRLGAEVTVVEYLDRILPGMDLEIAKEAQKILARQGLKFQLASRVTGARRDGEGAVVDIDGAPSIHCDRVLLAVGRIPNTEGLGLANVGIETGKRGIIPVDEHYQTAVAGIYAVGDVIDGPMLAHKAEDEGVACVEGIVNGYGHVNYDAVPGIVYTEPEVAAVGKTEEQLKEAGVEYRKGVFPFIANGRAKALSSTQGRVKILADRATDRILGVHIVGARAGDIIAEAAAAIEFGATAEDVARTCHGHPTLAEAFKQAALAVDGRATQI